MKRRQVENEILPKLGLKQIDIYKAAEDRLAVYCTVSGGHIKDWTGHVVTGMNDDLDGYIEWGKGGNAWRRKFDDENYRVQIMKNGLRCDPEGKNLEK